MRLINFDGRHYRVGDAPAMQAAVPKWFDGALGRRLLAVQRNACRRLSVPPGFRLLHLGVSPRHGVADCFSLPCRFTFVQEPDTGVDGVSRFDALPLPSDTFDLVVLHHALDFCRQPQRVLAEAARVVRPGGRIVLIGFNPYSLLGIGKWLLAPWHPAGIWRHNSLRRSRIADWLALLGFALDPPPETIGVGADSDARIAARVTRFWARLPFRGVVGFYLVTGCKRTIPLQPLQGLPWLPRRLAGLGGALNRAPAPAASGDRIAKRRRKNRRLR